MFAYINVSLFSYASTLKLYILVSQLKTLLCKVMSRDHCFHQGAPLIATSFCEHLYNLVDKQILLCCEESGGGGGSFTSVTVAIYFTSLHYQ